MVNIPTVETLKLRFPEFAPVDDGRIALFIAEASSRVDDTWLEKDQSTAIMNLACHQMALEGEPSASANGVSNSAKTNVKDGRFLKSRQVGDTKNEWAESAAQTAASSMSPTASQAGYRSTVYGAKFLKLMRLNHTGSRVV